MARTASTGTQYIKLEQRLVLLGWLNSLFGYESNQDMLSDVTEVEGFDASGRSHVYQHLKARGDKVKIPLEYLTQYDNNIREHLRAMNVRRSEPITLRYFQHVAVLYTEIFLDWYFRRRSGLLRALNSYVDRRNAARPAGDEQDTKFAHRDLTKLAFWMATGSGKTLIMHINYRQFLHYNDRPLDNILLITPNEGLTVQHLDEMTISNIPCRRFDLNESSLELGKKDVVRVIEITKLVENKRGGGVSVPVDAFEGNNLIFVDEGHKGTGGAVWRNFRDALGETGFTFEYSATFGQALTASRKDRLTAEYGKSICFDYSYKYFYADGYGKNFRILNLREETTEEKRDLLLVGNLLSFYEQLHYFAQEKNAIRPYNIEKPLWVFVGSTVQEDKQRRSDIFTVVRFVNRFLHNKERWAVRAIETVLKGKTGLEDGNGEDVFAEKFGRLRKIRDGSATLYRDILAQVFHAHGSGLLHMADIRGAEGELGLKVGGAENYFGLIYIGDTAKFKKLVEEQDSEIVQEEDVIGDSMFGSINTPRTTINLLIGAKKFMEGWNSWRVSNMGLLNIGRKEGSEIIQLFGRGVRLRGLDYSLKRSTALDGQHPNDIQILEMLNIFALRANYMVQFREYLEREDVDVEGYVELPVAIKPNRNFLRKGLVVARVAGEKSFLNEESVVVEADRGITVNVDLSLKVQALESQESGVEASSLKAGKQVSISSDALDLVNWEAVYLDLLEYKRQKGYYNLAIQSAVAREILECRDPATYRLTVDETLVNPKLFVQVHDLQNVVLIILRKYIDKFYRVRQEQWDSDNMVYTSLVREDANFQDYVVKVPRTERGLLSSVRDLIEEGERIYQEDTKTLPALHFDRHVYQPLLIEKGDKIKSKPPGLNDSERQFVEDLRDFVRREADGLLASKEIFLLRNLTRGKGVGFFDRRGFYPDFILWIQEGKKQRVVFIEPHGMLQAEAYAHDDKVRLHEKLPELSKKLGERSRMADVAMDSFIVSATPFDDLHKKYDDGTWDREKFAEKHILFREQRSRNYDYVSLLFTGVASHMTTRT